MSNGVDCDLHRCLGGCALERRISPLQPPRGQTQSIRTANYQTVRHQRAQDLCLPGSRSRHLRCLLFIWLLVEHVLQWLQIRSVKDGQKIQTFSQNRGNLIAAWLKGLWINLSCDFSHRSKKLKRGCTCCRQWLVLSTRQLLPRLLQTRRNLKGMHPSADLGSNLVDRSLAWPLAWTSVPTVTVISTTWTTGVQRWVDVKILCKGDYIHFIFKFRLWA